MPGAALHGLAVEDLDRASGAGVDLVVHHVLEPLVVGGAEEYLSIQLAARVSVVQHLATIKRFIGSYSVPTGLKA